MAEIKDFGEKIGGARKDVWKATGITLDHLSEMNEMERETHIKKDNIWIRPDWEKVVAEGTPQAVAYWQNEMRKAIPPKPPGVRQGDLENYIDIVSEIRDAVMAVRKPEEIGRFYQDFIQPNFVTSRTGYRVTLKPEADGVISNKVLSTSQANHSKMERDAKKKLFGIPKEDHAYVSAKQNLEIFHYNGDSVSLDQDPYDETATRMTVKSPLGRTYFYFREGSAYHDIDKWELNTYFVMGANRKPLRINIPSEDEAKAFIEEYARASQIDSSIEKESKEQGDSKSNRKKNFVPAQLAYVRYTGPRYRGVRHATGEMFLEELKFRGGEFGNWLNENDRQTSLNMGYDALRNLADLLKVRPEDVSLNGSLAIAFGARGRGGASAGAAHYEPLRQVINLTKMAGAGCLAHEWGHALDHMIGISVGETGFASEVNGKKAKEIPESFRGLMDKLQYKEAMVSADEQRKQLDPKVEHAKKNLRNWIKSVKPSNLPESLTEDWDATEKRILEHPETFTGGEYWTIGKGTAPGHPDIEALSKIRKLATGHVIPKDSKHQITLWAKELHSYQKQVAELAATKKQVKTDFYKDSVEFGQTFTSMGQGYWQSKCEMFARAFDCYIADKIKEAGYRSDFLSSHADSFFFKKDGRVIAAFPQGEERVVINQAFDRLFEDLKERGLLQEAVVVPLSERETDGRELNGPVWKTMDETRFQPDKKEQFEQLSLDELMFAAALQVQKKSGNRWDVPDREL